MNKYQDNDDEQRSTTPPRLALQEMSRRDDTGQEHFGGTKTLETKMVRIERLHVGVARGR